MIFWLSLTALSPLPWQKNINICILYLFLCVWRKGVVKNKNKCKFHFVISSQVFLADCTSNPINHWLLEPPWRINSTVLLRDSLAWLESRGASFSTFSTKNWQQLRGRLIAMQIFTMTEWAPCLSMLFVNSTTGSGSMALDDPVPLKRQSYLFWFITHPWCCFTSCTAFGLTYKNATTFPEQRPIIEPTPVLMTIIQRKIIIYLWYCSSKGKPCTVLPATTHERTQKCK